MYACEYSIFSTADEVEGACAFKDLYPGNY